MRANMGSTRRTCAVRKRTEQKTRKQGTRKDGTAAFARRASPPRLRQRLGTHLAGWRKVRCRQHVSLHRALTDGGEKKVQRHCVRSPSGHPSHTCVRACGQDLQHVPARRKRASFTRGQACKVGGQGTFASERSGPLSRAENDGALRWASALASALSKDPFGKAHGDELGCTSLGDGGARMVRSNTRKLKVHRKLNVIFVGRRYDEGAGLSKYTINFRFMKLKFKRFDICLY